MVGEILKKLKLLNFNILFVAILIIFMTLTSYNQAFATNMYPCDIAQSGMIVPQAEVQADLPRAEAENKIKIAAAQAVAKAAAAEAEQVSRSGSGDVRTVLAKAQSLLGTKYVSGGESPRGFDCSGFVKYVYSFAGVKLARTAADQASNGVHVDKSSLQPGDLVFFSYYGSKGIGHSGIYLGNNKFIHAENRAKGVVITDINSSYYLKNYKGARRVLR